MSNLTIHRKPIVVGEIRRLPASKSISNRALILNALSGNQSIVSNLASARDTQLMKRLVGSRDKTIDVMDAGTTMRFLTAFFAVSNQNKVLTGTARMKERPIGLLVEALQKIGAEIEYLEEKGFPPIETKSFYGQKTADISLPGNVSSQYISALMMVAPTLPGGLTIHMEGKVGSRPYIEMTAALMKQFGVNCHVNASTIEIPHSTYTPTQIKVEPDWSALSYWFAIVALAEKAEVRLKDVPSESIQGDRVIVEIMDQLGVQTSFENGDALLTKKEPKSKTTTWDFTNCPDLAQSVLPVCALKGISGSFTGLESLYIKETDRITALRKELAKVGAKLEEPNSGVYELIPGEVPQSMIQVDTYHDHRMAMGLAPWATLVDVEVKEPEVVNKSYPEFWDDLKSIGFTIS